MAWSDVTEPINITLHVLSGPPLPDSITKVATNWSHGSSSGALRWPGPDADFEIPTTECVFALEDSAGRLASSSAIEIAWENPPSKDTALEDSETTLSDLEGGLTDAQRIGLCFGSTFGGGAIVYIIGYSCYRRWRNARYSRWDHLRRFERKETRRARRERRRRRRDGHDMEMGDVNTTAGIGDGPRGGSIRYHVPDEFGMGPDETQPSYPERTWNPQTGVPPPAPTPP
ncbi:hypothetical protein V8F20_009417 [Naviculisporaceae sp. PSN 640]